MNNLLARKLHDLRKRKMPTAEKLEEAMKVLEQENCEHQMIGGECVKCDKRESEA